MKKSSTLSLPAVSRCLLAAFVALPSSAAVFHVSTATVVKPGQISSPSGELLDTKVKGIVTANVVAALPDDFGIIIFIAGALFEHTEDSCSDVSSSLDVCNGTVPFGGVGQRVSCAIPPTGTETRDCDAYYKTRGHVTFRGTTTLESSANCAGIPCDCT